MYPHSLYDQISVSPNPSSLRKSPMKPQPANVRFYFSNDTLHLAGVGLAPVPVEFQVTYKHKGECHTCVLNARSCVDAHRVVLSNTTENLLVSVCFKATGKQISGLTDKEFAGVSMEYAFQAVDEGVLLCEMRLKFLDVICPPNKVDEPAWRVFLQGYQSWSTAKSRCCEREKQKISLLSRLGLGVMFFDTDSLKWGHSDGIQASTMLLLRAHTLDDSFVIGATTSRVAVTEVWAESSGVNAFVTMIMDYEDKPVPVVSAVNLGKNAGDSLDDAPALIGESVVVLTGRSDHGLLDWYAELSASKKFNTTSKLLLRMVQEQGGTASPVTGKASPTDRGASLTDRGVDTQAHPTTRRGNNKTYHHEPVVTNRHKRTSKLHCNERAPVGWGSWYQFYNDVTEEDMHGMIQVFSNDRMLNNVVDFLQLDDGYQMEVGDWLDTDQKKFPSGLKDLADRIEAAGFVPGLWTAPFIGGKGSRLFKEHPEWFLRSEKNPKKHVLAHINPFWGWTRSAFTYCIDLSHPGVLDYLFQTFRTLREYGFVLFKIDFLAAGMRRGIRHDKSVTRVEAYMNGLRVIRDAIGDGGFLLGCGAPLAPVQSGNIFDAMRVSRDTAGQWHEHWIAKHICEDFPAPCVKGAMLGNVTRWFMHRRAWQFNDPDCLVLRKAALSHEQVVTQVTLLAMTGGLLTFTDDMRTLCTDRVDLARKVLPPTRLRGWPLNFMDTTNANIFVCMEPHHAGKGGVIAFVNWLDRAKDTHHIETTWEKALKTAKAWHIGHDDDDCPEEMDKDIVIPATHTELFRAPVTFCFDFWSERLLCQLEDLTGVERGEQAMNREDEELVVETKDEADSELQQHPVTCEQRGSSCKERGLSCQERVSRRRSKRMSQHYCDVPPHSVVALQMTPSFDPSNPVVVGTNFHLLALADGLVSWHTDPDKRMVTVTGSTTMGNFEGSVWVFVPWNLAFSFRVCHASKFVNCTATIHSSTDDSHVAISDKNKKRKSLAHYSSSRFDGTCIKVDVCWSVGNNGQGREWAFAATW